MQSITQQEITDYVAANIQVFHQKRLDSLQKSSNSIQQIPHLENQCQTRLSESNLLFRDIQLFFG